MKKTKALWIFIGVLVVFNLSAYLTKFGGEKVLLYISDLLPVVCSFISSVCLFFVIRKMGTFDSAKIAWFLILVGITLNFFAETTYAILELGYSVNLNEVFPSIADYIWCIAYIPLFSGLVVMFIGYQRSGMPMGKIKLYGMLSLLILIIFSIVIYFLLIPIINDTETDLVAKFFYLFYPIGDLFIVLPTVILMYITSLFGKGIITRPWTYLAVGFSFFTVADLLYSYLSWLDLYGSGNPIDIAWNIGYLLIGISGLYQTELIDSIN